MKSILLVIICCLCGYASSQDTLFQEIENVEIHASKEKEIVFGDSKHYVLDFYVGSKGKFLLLKRRKSYLVCSLDDELNIESHLQLEFKPQKLFADCLGFLHVLSSDSMYQIEIVENKLIIYETSPISLYHAFFENCITSNRSQLVVKHLEEFNQTTVFTGINRTNNQRNELYRVEDPMLVHSAQDTYDSLMFYDPGDLAIMGGIKGYDLEFTYYYDFIHHHKQELNFFEQIVTLPDYIPVFSMDDTTVIFDYMNEQVVLLDDGGQVQKAHPISFDTGRQILFDQGTHQFYAAFIDKGAQVYGHLSTTDFELESETKISKQAHIPKAIIYGDMIYYLGKLSMSDNLNKLFRQRVKR
ncbi:MAG: hypothetical protein AB8B56_08795 [Crocinitomicaceae bacterium]